MQHHYLHLKVMFKVPYLLLALTNGLYSITYFAPLTPLCQVDINILGILASAILIEYYDRYHYGHLSPNHYFKFD